MSSRHISNEFTNLPTREKKEKIVGKHEKPQFIPIWITVGVDWWFVFECECSKFAYKSENYVNLRHKIQQTHLLWHTRYPGKYSYLRKYMSAKHKFNAKNFIRLKIYYTNTMMASLEEGSFFVWLCVKIWQHVPNEVIIISKSS